MRRTDGFTLVELILVAVVIIIILAVTIPVLLRRSIQSNESSAIGHCRTITGAEVAYYSANGVYTTSFADLTNPLRGGTLLLEEAWDAGPKDGYIFKLSGDTDCFEVYATPATSRSGIRCFHTDCAGVIHTGLSYADLTAPAIDDGLE